MAEKKEDPLPVYSRPKDDSDIEDEKENDQMASVDVFVRMRPLIGHEIQQNHKWLEFKITKNKEIQSQNLKLLKVAGRELDRNKKFCGFTGVLNPSSSNGETFSKCIAPACVPGVLAGQKVCLFAYGHTGSGKTHTIFGYDDEPGMYHLFARDLLGNDKIKKMDDISVEIRFAELYQGKIYDLLSDNKAECILREDEKGVIRIRSLPEKSDNGRAITHTVSSRKVQTVDQLEQVVSVGIQSRNVGCSSLHAKSSRSHAFLEFEIVSDALVKERKKLEKLETAIVLHQCVRDTPTMKELLAQYGKEEAIPPAKKKMAELMEDSTLQKLGAMHSRKLKMEIKSLRAEEKKIRKNIEKICSDPQRSFVGGTMVFVDLAGNEYGRDVKTHDVQQEKERNEINKSLLALKECIRVLHKKRNGGGQKHVGYRNSKLTMYLREYLSGKNSKAIMIGTIGSSREYIKQTINTLTYSQLIANANTKN